jgi:hypothetical protein
MQSLQGGKFPQQQCVTCSAAELNVRSKDLCAEAAICPIEGRRSPRIAPKATAFEAKRMEDERIFGIISAIVLEEELRAV